MRKLLLLLCLFLPGLAGAVDLSRVEIYLAGNNLEGAQQALQAEYEKSSSRHDKEQLQYKMAQVALLQKKPQKAIAVFRNMLANNPALLRVRCELAYLYFLEKEDAAARYHARLALADAHLPAVYRTQLENMLSVLRRRRAWQLYVSVGMTPDSNINTMSGRQIECVTVMGLPFCRELEDIKKDVGFQGLASLSYVYKLTEHWGVKGRLNWDVLDYKEDRYSFWGLGGDLGPRYVTEDNEYGAGVSYRQQWNDHQRYSHAVGGFGEWQSDLSRRLSLRARLSLDRVEYNRAEYQGYNADNYGALLRLVYGIDSRSYASLSGFWMYEDSQTDWNSNFRQRYGIGYGTELPWGFNVYVEPNATCVHYRQGRNFIGKNSRLEWLKRQDATYGVYVTLSNKHLRFYNITPTVSYIYNRRFSNVNNYDYARTRWEIGLSKSF